MWVTYRSSAETLGNQAMDINAGRSLTAITVIDITVDMMMPAPIEIKAPLNLNL